MVHRNGQIYLSIGEGGTTATAWQADRVRNRIEECNPNGSKMGAFLKQNKDKSSFWAILGTLSKFSLLLSYSVGRSLKWITGLKSFMSWR